MIRVEDGMYIFDDCEYENDVLIVGDNKDPYGIKPIYLETKGACGLSLVQIDELITILMTVSANYDEYK